MAKLEKAQITYKVGEGDSAAESILRFHSVITEDHDITNEITKFPVQSGFNISNHAIKKNRKVSITGVISNHLIVGAEEFHEFGGNNSKIVFFTLRTLVGSAIPCEVVTNYGNYSPVIFTKFKTKLQAGKTDIMEFTISGEEVQLATTVNTTTPTLLIFTKLTDTKRAARIAKLIQAGLDVAEDAIISEAPVDFNESFQVETKATNGDAILITYEKTAYDETTKMYSHTVHTNDINVVGKEVTTNLNWFQIVAEENALPNVGLEVGLETAGACLVDGLVGIGTEIVEDKINTAIGELTKSIYGASYGVFGVNGDKSFGQVLLALGTDCLVAGALGSIGVTDADDFQDNNIPNIEEVLAGAASIGDSVVTDTLGVAAPTTLTKISSPDESTSFFGDSI